MQPGNAYGIALLEVLNAGAERCDNASHLVPWHEPYVRLLPANPSSAACRSVWQTPHASDLHQQFPDRDRESECRRSSAAFRTRERPQPSWSLSSNFSTFLFIQEVMDKCSVNRARSAVPLQLMRMSGCTSALIGWANHSSAARAGAVQR